MAEGSTFAVAAELTPGIGGDSAGDASGSLSEGGKGRGQSRAKAAQQRQNARALAKPVVRRHVMKDLTKEEIQAMVDLAYWSDFDTSRRDAASAFATLSMNDHNVGVLDRAGVLGAVLALVAREAPLVRKRRPLSKASTECLQDAAWCLRRMLRRDEIKSRFLEAPAGLSNVIALTGSDEISLRLAAVRILDTLCAYPPAQPAIVREGGARVLVAQLASVDETLRRTAARVVRGLSRSPHTTPKNLMDADIVRFLLCLLEEGDEPAGDQEESLCIAYFTKVSSNEEACSELVELGLSRYLIRVLPERRLSLQIRLAMLQALARMAGSPLCDGRLVDEGLFEALVVLCFNEIASFVHGCQNYLRQRREIEGEGGGGRPCSGAQGLARPAPSIGGSSPKGGGRIAGPGGYAAGDMDGIGGRGLGGERSASVVSVGALPAASGVGGRQREAEAKFSEEKLEVAMNVARTGMSMLAHLAAKGHGRRALHAGVLAYVNSVPIGAGDDPHMTGSLSQLVLELSRVAMGGEDDRLSFVAQGPLDAIMRCLKGGRAAQQQCALDALTSVCLLTETKPLVFSREVLGEVLTLAAVQEHIQPAAFILHQFSLIAEWRSPLVRGGCVELLVGAIAHATGPEAPPEAEARSIIGSAVAALGQITKLEGAGRVLVAVGGLPHLLRLSRSEHENIRRDSNKALRNIGHKGRERGKQSDAQKKEGDPTTAAATSAAG